MPLLKSMSSNLEKLEELSKNLDSKDLHFSAFFVMAPRLMTVIDARGFFAAVNPAWTDLLGWSTGELTDRPWAYYLHPDDVQRSIEITLTMRGLNETATGFVNRYRKKDGGYQGISWDASVFIDGFSYAISTPVDWEEYAARTKHLG